MAEKVLVVGIDGLDPILLDRWREKLPHFRGMEEEGAFLKLQSVFPPDSVPAWTSIYTGLTPAAHGLLQSIDVLGRKHPKEVTIDFSPFQEKTFWDLAGRADKKVCIVNPFLAYPVWPVNGIMVSGPVFIGGPVQAYPNEVMREHHVPQLGGIVDFPTRKTLHSFCQMTQQMTEAETKFGLTLLRKDDWDLFFICFLTLDRVQHFFWRYFDRGDPTYPGDGPYEDIVMEFYRHFDDIIGRFWRQLGQDWAMLVISDHGHGRRSTKTLNLNEFLRQKGYLSSRVSRMKLLDHRYLVERLKAKIFRIMYERDLDDLILKMVKYIPGRKALKDSSFITDRERSLAYVPDFAGRNPFGGVIICRAEVEKRGLHYEDLRERLIGEISMIRDTHGGERVVKWIARREDIDAGQHLDKYPDLVFELREDYGVSWTLHGDPVGINPSHKKVSGGHRREGVLMMVNTGREVAVNHPDLTDIAPTIMDLLGLHLAEHFNGASIFR